MTAFSQKSFSGGEIAPELFGHVDHAKYATALRACRNFCVMRHGGVANRPGTQFVAEVRDSTAAVRLIPFIFNQQAGQTYIIEFSNLKIRFYQNGAQVVEAAKNITNASQAGQCLITSNAHGFANGDEVVITGVLGMTELNGRNYLVANSAANTFTLQDKSGAAINSTAFTAYISGGTASRVYELVSPYAQADLSSLKYAQTNDVMTITHVSYAPRELQRIAATNWQFVVITFGAPVGQPSAGLSMTGTAGAPNPWNQYAVTSVNSNGEESTFGAFMVTPVTAAAVALATAGTPVTLAWTTVANAVYYKVYRCTQRAVGAPPYAQGPLGYIGQTTDVRYVDSGDIPDYNNVPPLLNAPFSGAGEWPGAVGFIQQRRGFAASTNKPTTIWMSVPGSFANLNYHSLAVDDDDGITFIPSSEQVNQIQHLVALKAMLALTAGGELWIQGDAAGIVKPSAINPQAQSYYGAGALKPIVVGDVCIFQQARGWFIRDFGFDFQIDGYRGNDLTIFAPHLFRGYTLVDWTYQQIPHSIIWGIRSDGTVVALSYLREQQILAWHRHDFSGGTAENVACVPESPEDGVYFVVKRTVNNRTVRYVERLSPFQLPAYNPSGASPANYGDVINATYLDSWLKFDGTNYGATTMTLTGATWTVGGSLTLTASVPFFTSAMLGDEIFMNASDGTQIRCLITAFTSTTIVTITPQRDVPVILRSVAITNWARAIPTVTNLWTLEGKTVSVFADRFVVGSPNNPAYPTYTVSGGRITLDKQYSVIYVGLPITADLDTLDLDTASGESSKDDKALVSRLSVLVNQARGLWAGSQNPDSDLLNTTDSYLYGLFEMMAQSDRQTYDQPPNLLSEVGRVEIQADWVHQGHVFIRQVDPLPLQILSIVPTGFILGPGQASNAMRP